MGGKAKVICYLCGSANYEQIHEGTRDDSGLNVVRCKDCGLVFLDRKCREVDDFYRNSGMRNGNAQDINCIRNAAYNDDRRRFESVRNLIENKRVLDFGCGAGGFIHLAKDHTKEIEGVELEERMQNILYEEGIVCYSDIDNVVNAIEDQKCEKFDVITLFHVLEHLSDPVEILRKIGRCLGEKGSVIVEVPNADEAMLSLYKCKSFADFTYWSCHLYLFNNNTLRKVIEKAGYHVEFFSQIQRYPLANHLRWLSQGMKGGHQEWEMLMDKSLDEAYGKKMAQLGIADTIFVKIVKDKE